MVEEKLRRAFGYLNRYLMVPLFRLGLAPFIGSPFGGYIMVLKVIGRKTGKLRYTPVNYAIADGNVYCLAGFGAISDWYRNLLAYPNIEAMMPGGTIAGIADTVTDSFVFAHCTRLHQFGFCDMLYLHFTRSNR